MFLLVSKAGAKPQILKLVDGQVLEIQERKLPFKSALTQTRKRFDVIKFLKFLGNATMYLVATFALLTILAINTNHISARVVLTNSMSGTIEPGDVVVTANWLKPEVGQIAMYQAKDFQGNPTAEFIHRAIAYSDSRGYDFKGDFNVVKDPQAVPVEDVVGTLMFYIPNLGIYLQPTFMVAFIAVSVFIYLLIEYVRDAMFERKFFRKARRRN